MSDTVITVDNVSKRYVIRHQSQRHRDDGLRHSIEAVVRAPLNWTWMT